MPGVNLDDRLRLVPGFTLLRRSSSLVANPTTQGISLRGIGSSGASRTLVLADGVPLNDPFGGWVYWSRIPPELVDRVELSRGASTSVFGDRAMGGAIHFLSATPAAERVTIIAEGGNRGTASPFVSYTNLFRQRFGVTAAARALTTSGFEIVPANIRGAADTKANSRFLAPQLKADWTGQDQRLLLKGDLLVEARANGTALTRNSTSLGAAAAHYLLARADHTVSLLAFHQRQQFHASFSALSADRNTERLTFRQSVPSEATGGAAIISLRRAAWETAAGVDFLRTSGVSRDYLVPSGQREGGGTIWQRGSFTQSTLRWRSWRLFGGSRFHWTGLEREPRFFSPSGGLTWSRRIVRARASAYRAFRAPTLNELFREFRVGNTVTLANRELRPERLTGVETGIDLHGERTRLSVTLYRNALAALIGNATLLVQPNFLTRQRQNLAAAQARGLEVDLRRQWRQWTAEAAYLLADSRLLTGERIPQVARHQGSLQLTWRDGRTQVSGGLRSTSLQFEDDRNTLLLPGYAIFHTTALRELRAGWSLQAAVENAGGRLYLAGFTPQPQLAAPRLWRLGLRYQGRLRP